MGLKNTTLTYGTVARYIHWATAFIVLFLLALGLYMEDLDFSPQKLALYGLHKSFGFTVLGLVIVRILWRAANPAPHHLATHQRWEVLLARFMHVCLYLALIGMPLSGWVMSSAADFPHTFFNLFSMPDLIPGKNDALYKLSRLAHGWCAYALIAAIGLHMAGALKHHVIDRDSTLRRMLPDNTAKSFAALLFIMVGLTGLYYLPRPGADTHTAAVVAAAPLTETISEVAAITAPAWTIDPAASHAEFTATVQGSPFAGRFAPVTGTIHFDPDNLSGSHVNVAVPINSIKSGSTERDDAIILPVWFDAESFPESRFQARDFTAVGGTQYVANGVLTIRDVTLPVSVVFTLDISTDDAGNKVAKMDGSFDLNRLDFGVGQGDWAGTGTVANQVNVRVSVTARSETPPQTP